MAGPAQPPARSGAAPSRAGVAPVFRHDAADVSGHLCDRRADPRPAIGLVEPVRPGGAGTALGRLGIAGLCAGLPDGGAVPGDRHGFSLFAGDLPVLPGNGGGGRQRLSLAGGLPHGCPDGTAGARWPLLRALPHGLWLQCARHPWHPGDALHRPAAAHHAGDPLLALLGPLERVSVHGGGILHAQPGGPCDFWPLSNEFRGGDSHRPALPGPLCRRGTTGVGTAALSLAHTTPDPHAGLGRGASLLVLGPALHRYRRGGRVAAQQPAPGCAPRLGPDPLGPTRPTAPPPPRPHRHRPHLDGGPGVWLHRQGDRAGRAGGDLRPSRHHPAGPGHGRPGELAPGGELHAVHPALCALPLDRGGDPQ